MGKPIELIAFMGLRKLFGERGWSIPYFMEIETDMAGDELLQFLSIDSASVESFIVNRSAIAVEDAVIHPGDRVALVPPGVPGPHRLLLGIHGQTKPAQPFGMTFSAANDRNEEDKG
jgi:hypothetical protein